MASRSATPRRSTRSQSRDPEGVEVTASSSALLSPTSEKQVVRRKPRTPKPKKGVEEVIEEEIGEIAQVVNVPVVVNGTAAKRIVSRKSDIVKDSIVTNSIVTEPQKPSRGRIRLRRLIAGSGKIVPYLTPTLIALAVVLLFAVPTPEKPFKRNVYVDENALQPGSATVYWNWGEVEYADAVADRIRGVAGHDAETRAALISRELAGIGVRAYNQSYLYTTPGGGSRRGINTYARWSAARGDGREAFVIAAAWKSTWNGVGDPEAEQGEDLKRFSGKVGRRTNVRGIATALTIARHLISFSHWSKDLLFVVADDEFEGMQAWASKYFGREQPNLHSDELHGRGSQVWNALAIDYPSDSFSHIILKQEGLDGQLPNMDVISTLTHVMNRAGGVPVELEASSVDQWPHRPLGRLGDLVEQYLFRGGDGSRRYLSGLWNAVNQFATLSSGKPSGIHGLLHRYHVDAITIFARPASGPYGFWHMGRVVESYSRSMSNLLERLHHSHFFYILTSPDHFVEVAKYLPIAILFSLALLIQGLAVWYDEGRRSVSRQDRLIELIESAIREEAEEMKADTARSSITDVPLDHPTIAQRTAKLVAVVVERASRTGGLIGTTKVRSVARLLDLFGRPYGTALTVVLLAHAFGVFALARASNTAIDCSAQGLERCYSVLHLSATTLLATTMIPLLIKRSGSSQLLDQLDAVQTLLPDQALFSAYSMANFRARSVARTAVAIATIEASLLVFVLSLVNFSLAAVLGFLLSVALYATRLPASETGYEAITQGDRGNRSGTPASDDSDAVEQEIVSLGRSTGLRMVNRVYMLVQALLLLSLTPSIAVLLFKAVQTMTVRSLPVLIADLTLLDRAVDGAVWTHHILSSNLFPTLFLAYLPVLLTAATSSLLIAFSRA